MATSQLKQQLHTRAAKIPVHDLPKCPACQFGGQTNRPVPGSKQVVNRQRQGITSADRLYPGQLMFLDHFHSTARGRKNSGHGVSVNSKVGGRSYGGRCIAVCGATDYIMVECQTSFSAASTVEAIKEFEQHALDHGVVIKSYQLDNGSAFTSKLFKQQLLDTNKDLRFSAAGSHHQNGKAERAI